MRSDQFSRQKFTTWWRTYKMRLSLLSWRICLLSATKIVFRLLNLIELGINNPLININICIHSIKQSVSKKVDAGMRVLFEPFQQYGSQNKFCCCLFSCPNIFSKDSCITCRKKAFSIRFLSYLIFNSTFCKCTAYRYISFDTFRNFFLHDFFSRINVFFFSVFCSFKGHNFWNSVL